MKGAFKTPTLRDVEYTAPYFHDGSAKNLTAVMNHYESGGVNKSNLSPNLKSLELSPEEKQRIILFLKSLSSPVNQLSTPIAPVNTLTE